METLVIGVLSVLVIAALIIERYYVIRRLGFFRTRRNEDEINEFTLTITDGDNGRWRVLDEDNRLPGARQVLEAGDRVTWTLQTENPETVVELSFPSSVFTEVDPSVGAYHRVLRNGEELELTVSEEPPPGRYPYSVQIGTLDQETREFIGDFGVFVQGGSHTEVHIEWE